MVYFYVVASLVIVDSLLGLLRRNYSQKDKHTEAILEWD